MGSTGGGRRATTACLRRSAPSNGCSIARLSDEKTKCGCRRTISAIRGRREGVLALNCLYCLVLKCVSNKYSCSELCCSSGVVVLFISRQNLAFGAQRNLCFLYRCWCSK